MQLWVGLGNPGAKHALQRHNVGFMAADILAEAHDFSPWSKKFRALIAEGRIGLQRILLLKPQTFMNDSGDAVQQALKFYKLDMDALTVFHDELDLAPFKVKVKQGGGTVIRGRVARTSSRPTCSAITRRPRWSRCPTYSRRSLERRSGWPMAMTRAL
jgi:aminoacyl-tRNA hydrolase